MTTVLVTDYAWPDLSIETELAQAAGFRLVAGPSTPKPAEEIERLVQEHQPAAILTCWAPVSARAVVSSAPLKVVSRLGVGLDNIAVGACTERGVWVTNVPDYCVEEVSDHAVGLLLAWARGLVGFDRSVKDGNWNPAAARLRRVSDMTVGVIGYGRIARRSLHKLQAWGCRLLVHNRTPIVDSAMEQVSLQALLEASDVIVVHVPLAAETRYLLNDTTLAQVKPGAFLINVSRGGVVNNEALLRALESGRLSGAGLDVLEGEPAPPREIVARPDVIVTPHVAFSSSASLAQLRRDAMRCALAVLQGTRPVPNACNNPS